MITYRPLDREYMENVKELYAALGWTAYLGDDPRLYRAWEASLYALGAFEGDRLIGFIRCIGDGAHTVLIQDLLVDLDVALALPLLLRDRSQPGPPPALLVLEAQPRRGLGKALLEAALEKYADVRQKFVVTGADTPAVRFYRALGLYSFEEGEMEGFFKL